MDKKMLYINYISKYNSAIKRIIDHINYNFEYKNILEIENTYNKEPVALMDYINKNAIYYNTIIINLNNISSDIEEKIIYSIEAVVEYLGSEMYDIDDIPNIIFINKSNIYNININKY